MLLGDAYQVAVKVKSSESGGLYTIRMENASIIRKCAQFIKSNLLVMMGEGVIEEAHGHVIRDEIDKFRELFRHWVSTFQKDEYEDEWGLFI
jgi:flavorubredoxin